MDLYDSIGFGQVKKTNLSLEYTQGRITCIPRHSNENVHCQKCLFKLFGVFFFCYIELLQCTTLCVCSLGRGGGGGVQQSRTLRYIVILQSPPSVRDSNKIHKDHLEMSYFCYWRGSPPTLAYLEQWPHHSVCDSLH